jgi:integrase
MRRKLTDRLLRSLADKAVPTTVWDETTSGFAIRVGRTGASFFVMRRQRHGNGKPIRIRIGRYGLLSLAEARERAFDALRDLATGVDPRVREAERLKAEAAKGQNTFRAIAEAFITRHAAKKRTGRAIELLIRRELLTRPWADKPIGEVTRDDIVAVIDEIVDRGHEAAAHQMFGYGRCLFNWALTRGTFGLEHSPFDRLKRGNLIGPKRSRDRLLSPAELALIWKATAGAPTEIYPEGQYIRLLLLLGVRRGELAGAKWSEFFDLDKAGAARWIIPGGVLGRMKNFDPFLVLPSPAAVDILKALPRFEGCDYLFTARGNQAFSDFTGLKRRLDARITALNGGVPIPHWTLHDFRRCVRTNLSGLRVDRTVAEMILAHRQPGIVRTYDLDAHEGEKREALAAWATRLLAIVGDNIIHLRPAV